MAKAKTTRKGKDPASYVTIDALTGAGLVELTQGQIALIDARHVEAVSRYLWMAQRSKGIKGYYVLADRGRLLLGRFIAGLEGWDATGLYVDHKSGETLDYRVANLRLATPLENARNCKERPNATGHRGVVRTRNGRFQARISYRGKKRCLGTFDSAAEAAAAAEEARRRFYGEFRR